MTNPNGFDAVSALQQQSKYQYQETLTKLRQARTQSMMIGAQDYAVRLTQFDMARQAIEKQILSIMANPGLMV